MWPLSVDNTISSSTEDIDKISLRRNYLNEGSISQGTVSVYHYFYPKDIVNPEIMANFKIEEDIYVI